MKTRVVCGARRVQCCSPILLSAGLWAAGGLKSALGMTMAQTYQAWAHERRRGAHGRASRGHQAATDGATEGGLGDLVYIRCAYHSYIRVFALTCCTMVAPRYVVPPREEHFEILLILWREFKGAVGFALQIVAQKLQPHPSLPTPLVVPLYLGRLLLLTPWMEFSTDAPSHTHNKARYVLPLCMYRLFD